MTLWLFNIFIQCEDKDMEKSGDEQACMNMRVIGRLEF